VVAHRKAAGWCAPVWTRGSVCGFAEHGAADFLQFAVSRALTRSKSPWPSPMRTCCNWNGRATLGSFPRALWQSVRQRPIADLALGMRCSPVCLSAPTMLMFWKKPSFTTSEWSARSRPVVPYRDYIGSVLEILDVHAGKLEQVTPPPAFEAPNWTRDGRSLIYNVSGRRKAGALTRFDLTPKLRRCWTPRRQSEQQRPFLSFDAPCSASATKARITGPVLHFHRARPGGRPDGSRLDASYLHGWSRTASCSSSPAVAPTNSTSTKSPPMAVAPRCG